MEQNRLDQPISALAKPVLTMQPCPVDQAVFNEMSKVKDTVLDELGAEALVGETRDLVRAGLGGVAHEVGTLRMSDAGTGVVDDQLKMLGYDNLYVCDLSVFPTSPAANPSLTLVALALRLAEHLTI